MKPTHSLFLGALLTTGLAAETLIDATFDGVANDTNDSFSLLTNSPAITSGASWDPVPGLINRSTAANSTAGVVTDTTVDFTILGSGFVTLTLVSEGGGGSLVANGMFIGLLQGDGGTDGTELWNNLGPAFGLVINGTTTGRLGPLGVGPGGRTAAGVTFQNGPSYGATSAASINDGLTNLEEYHRGTDPNVADVDLDDLNDGREVAAGTNPFDPDSDDDGLNDGQEVNGTLNPYQIGHIPGTTPGGAPGEATDPLVKDSDNDGLTDYAELDSGNGFVTNPNDPDTDGDTLSDSIEIVNGIDPTDPNGNNGPDGDPDSDSLVNRDEVLAGTGLNDPDSDDDDLNDSQEVNGTLNPWFGGVNTATTPGEATNPLAADSDNDGLTDFAEINSGNGSVTDPNNRDTDGDTLLDGFEVAGGLDPLDDGTIGETSSGLRDGPNGDLGDPDQDNLPNFEEQTAKTNPNDNDTDDDTLLDGDEVKAHFTNPLLADTDGDLIRDDEELSAGADGFVTNPTNGDTDNNGFKDFIEIQAGSDPATDASTPTFPAITWSVRDFNEVTALSTEGTLLYAENFDGDDVTVNGIPFIGVSSTLSQKSGRWLQALLNNQSSTTTGLGALYDGEVPELVPLVTTFWYGPIVNAVNYGLTGLTPGKTYLVQVGRVDDRTGTIINRFMLMDGVGGNNTLDPVGPTNTTYGGPDNPAILFTGTFTAQFSVQAFKWEQYLAGAVPGVDAPLGSHIPFIQVREIGEPSAVTVTAVRRTATTAEVDFAGLNPAKTYQLVRSADLLEGFPTIVDGPRLAAGPADTFTDSAPPPVKAFYLLEEVP
jgi:hypothetical protein